MDPTKGLTSIAFSGLFGGDDAVAAIVKSAIYGNQEFAYYNSPGSQDVAAGLRRLAESVHPNGKAPKFTAVHSGTKLREAGAIAEALMKACRSVPPSATTEGRTTAPTNITVVKLEAPSGEQQQIPRIGGGSALIPTAVSAGAAIAAGASGDWAVAAMIVLGMVANGYTAGVLGEGRLALEAPKAAPGAPPGDGFLEDGNQIVILLGEEGAVSRVTRGHLKLRFAGAAARDRADACARLFTLQLLLQAVVVPMGSTIGQLCFLLTIAAAWIHNRSRAELMKGEPVPERLVKELLGEQNMKKFVANTRAAAAAFVAAQLKPDNIDGLLRELLPNDTPAWNKWRAVVVKAIEAESYAIDAKDEAHVEGIEEEKDQTLLQTLLTDAHAGLALLSKEKKSE